MVCAAFESGRKMKMWPIKWKLLSIALQTVHSIMWSKTLEWNRGWISRESVKKIDLALRFSETGKSQYFVTLGTLLSARVY